MGALDTIRGRAAMAKTVMSGAPMASSRMAALLTATLLLFACVLCARAEEASPVRVGIVTFLSGPGAGPMGVPARNAAELLFDALNSGAVPKPYHTRGFGGNPVEMVLIDEAGATSTVVTQYRNLVEQRNASIVIGYISSGSCLAVAPVAEEMKTLTVFFDCGTPRVFEDSSYRYVFRTASHATMDSVAAAKYVKEHLPGAKRIAGINQNYAWGQDSWNDFEASMRALVPGSRSPRRRCRSSSPVSTEVRSRRCSEPSRM